LFEENQKKKIYPKNRVKRVTTTLWISHYYALYTVLITFDSIMETLNYIKEIEGPGDRRSGVNVGGLLKYFTTKTFVFIAISFEIEFSILENTSILLQSSDFDFFSRFNYDRNLFKFNF
jgi:hypothetical protein